MKFLLFMVHESCLNLTYSRIFSCRSLNADSSLLNRALYLRSMAAVREIALGGFLLTVCIVIVADNLLTWRQPSQYVTSLLPMSMFVNPSQATQIWDVERSVDWKPCEWWKGEPLVPLPDKSNGYIKIDCYGGLNQMRRDFCDGVGIARLLNATLVLPDFEAATYWNDTSGFADIFDVEYFIEKMKGFVNVVKELPADLVGRVAVKVDCSKRKGHFDYVESVLPVLQEHKFISITPAMSQRSDRYALYAKAARCEACFRALRLVGKIQQKGEYLLKKIPRPFLSLHLRFEPDMIAYSRCQYMNLSFASIKAIDSARNGRIPWEGDAAISWRKRGKCPLTPEETAFILQSLHIPVNTTIYLASGDGLLEKEGFTNIYRNSYTKSDLLNEAFLGDMHGNSKAALDYYVSIHSYAYIATFFGNMDKMVSAMRVMNGLPKTLVLNRRKYVEALFAGLHGHNLSQVLWETHKSDFGEGRGTALTDCFCQQTL